MERSDQLIFGALILENEPLAAFWMKRQMDLSPSQITILIKLASSPIVSVDDIRNVFDKPLSKGTLRVYLHRMKLALPESIKIASVYGKGYKLIVEKGPQQSHDTAPSEDQNIKLCLEENAILRNMLVDLLVDNARLKTFVESYLA